MPPETTAFRLQTALLFLVCHWLLLVLLQSENYLGCATLKGKRRQVLGRWLLLLLRLQAEDGLVAALVGGLAYALAPGPVGRWIFFAGYVVLTVYIVADQAYYKRFLDHFRPSTVEGGEFLNPALLRSAASELDRQFLLNTMVAGCFLVGLAWSLAGFLPEVGGWERAAVLTASGTVCLVLLGLPAALRGNHQQLQRHALSVLVQDLCRRRLTVQGVASGRAETADRPALPEPEAGPPADARMTAALESIRGKVRKPNVVLIVLESVGGIQLFSKDGSPDPETTPHLADLGRHALVFPAVYSFYPGSVLTYMALETGGVHPTLDPAASVCSHGYDGPTLSRYFAAQGYRTAFFSSANLKFESMDLFAEQMHHHTLFHPGQNEKHRERRNMIHAWGVTEEYTLDHIEPWIQGSVADGVPFCLMYWTIATHHPHGAPPDYPTPFPGDDARDGQETQRLPPIYASCTAPSAAISSKLPSVRRRPSAMTITWSQSRAIISI